MVLRRKWTQFLHVFMKAKHNFKDSAITSATQINNTNISADILADALEDHE